MATADFGDYKPRPHWRL